MNAINPQNVAADPHASCFLTANAGSGKTSTLVNRVARLLLNGAKPEHILCVTYTKAAAAEMQGRLFERLGRWAVATDEKLAEDLRGIDEPADDLPRARALFAKALETPGGLKIQTIHAFCEKLLRRFPLEAGLSPAFKVLDDLLGQALAEEAKAGVLTMEAPSVADAAPARDRLIRKLKVAGFEKLLGQFIAQHDALFERFAELRSDPDWETKLFHSLGLDGVCTSHECLMAYAERLEWQLIRDLAGGLSAGTSKTNQEAGRAFLELHGRYHNDGHFDFELIRGVFLTKDGGPRKTPYTKETDPADAMLMDRLAAEIAELGDRLKAVEIAANTLDALALFRVFSAIYQVEKRSEGALDFTDLINRTKDMLRDAGQAAWVLYKLDGGLEHILVDEAQDTSDDQWVIVEALSYDFFSGEARARDIRTLFAVGDEKQSIYGFQGADPREFLEARHRIGGRAVAAGARLESPELIDSWRSLPEVLSFVDAVYEAPELAEALNFSADVIRHVARRRDAAGLVELWPLARPMAVVEATAEDEDQAALDDPGRSPPARRLAQQIAATIRSEIAVGRAVYDKAAGRMRPLHAGDVLILVRKRDHLFEHIIRELKIAGVPVSGADRLKLGDHIAFQDLRALLRFCLQPADSLSLACVLRSPLCDISEAELFELSYGRDGRSLWTALRAHPATEGPIDAARIFLSWAAKAAWQMTAFDFLSRVLNRRDLDGRSYRQRFLTRLGDECDDVLDETLALALKGEGVGASGLSTCLDLFEYHASEIKREQEEGGRAVRVMTVHGSKGLEAPWVIIPIGPQYGARKDDLMLGSDEGGLYLCAGGKKADTSAITAIRNARALRDDQEGLRLFYVALTRARDRLTVCGYVGVKAPAVGNFPSWYDLAEAAFERLPDPYGEAMKLVVPFDDMEQIEDAAVQLYGLRSEAMTAEALARPAESPLPAFANAPVNEVETESERWAAISQMGDEDRDEAEQAPSPLQTVGSLGRYRRGNLIHKLFEMLPDVSPAGREGVAARYLGRQSDLSDDQRAEMTGAVMAVLNDARFAEAFGPQSRPEVALAGQIGVNDRGEAIMLSGRIDRLVVTSDRVLIIDYKSNRPAPDRAEDAAIAYQRQMAGYVALLRQIHPQRKIEAALLWTDGPKLTPLSETLVNLRLAEILSRASPR